MAGTSRHPDLRRSVLTVTGGRIGKPGIGCPTGPPHDPSGLGAPLNRGGLIDLRCFEP